MPRADQVGTVEDQDHTSPLKQLRVAVGTVLPDLLLLLR